MMVAVALERERVPRDGAGVLRRDDIVTVQEVTFRVVAPLLLHAQTSKTPKEFLDEVRVNALKLSPGSGCTTHTLALCSWLQAGLNRLADFMLLVSRPLSSDSSGLALVPVSKVESVRAPCSEDKAIFNTTATLTMVW